MHGSSPTCQCPNPMIIGIMGSVSSEHSRIPPEPSGPVRAEFQQQPATAIAMLEGAVVAFDAAIAAIRARSPVLLLDDVSEPVTYATANLVIAAEHADTATMSLLVRETSGLVCVAMAGHRLDDLQLPPLAPSSRITQSPDFAVSVDLRDGITTGISAHDRAITVRALADTDMEAGDFTRPGHVMPVRIADGGVLQVPKPAEAAVELCKAAGLFPVAAFATVLDSSGDLATPADLEAIADRLGLPQVRVSEIIAWCRTRQAVRRVATTELPTVYGHFVATGYADMNGGEHLALLRGDPATNHSALVAVHAECVAGQALGSLHCSCSARLAATSKAIGRADHGVLLYLRGLQPLRLNGSRSLCTNWFSDAQNISLVTHILHDLGVREVDVVADNPTEFVVLPGYDIKVVGYRRPTVAIDPALPG